MGQSLGRPKRSRSEGWISIKPGVQKERKTQEERKRGKEQKRRLTFCTLHSPEVGGVPGNLVQPGLGIQDNVEAQGARWVTQRRKRESDIFPVPGTDTGTLQTSFLLSVPGSWRRYLHLLAEEREVQRGDITYSGSYS